MVEEETVGVFPREKKNPSGKKKREEQFLFLSVNGFFLFLRERKGSEKSFREREKKIGKKCPLGYLREF